MNKQLKKISVKRLLSATLMIGVLLVQFIPATPAGAAQITTRSLTLKGDGTNTNGSAPGAVVDHLFNFTVPNAGGGVVKSIKFEYCTTAADVGAGTCTTPNGLLTTSATLSNATGDGSGGFTLNNTTNGAPYLTRATETAIPAGTTLSFQLNNVKNPTDTTATPTVLTQTFFVRITTYTSEDTLSGKVDGGTVAASTNNGIDLQGTMPESLVFCTGKTVPLTATVPQVPDCTAANVSEVKFNQLFSPTETATATSQMSASTNAGSGYSITVNGPTLTSGSNTITAMANTDQTMHGVSQFGLNLRANTTASSTVAIGSEVSLASNGTNYKGQALTGYNTVDRFKYNNTAGQNIVANSGYKDGVSEELGGTDAQIFTVSYVVNVPGSQPAGDYSTTLTYICTPTF